MAKRLQLRRGTTAETNTFTGAVGEVTVDTNKKTVVVHDGVTAGGFPVAAIANNDGTISLIKKDGTVITTISASGLFNNTLTSTATDQALTAAQGKVLQDNKLDKTANAVSASKLATARTINGIAFDGTSNITIAAETPSITSINSNAALASVTTPGLYSVADYDIAGLYGYGLLRVWSYGGVWNQMYISHNPNHNGSVAIRQSWSGTAGYNAWRVIDSPNVTGNAATATRLATARTINGVSFDGTANINIADNTKLPLTGGTINGNLNVSDTITVTGVGDHANVFKKLIQGHTTTDGGYIAVGNNGSDLGYVEIGTIDDADTAICARKRNSANTVIDEAYILTSDGNTSFPRSVFIHNAVGGYSTCGLVAGNGDNATYGACNIDITSWWGLGIKASNSGERTVVFNARNGDIQNKGSVNSDWFVQAGKGIGISNSTGAGHGLSLYGGAVDGLPNYGIAFGQTYNFGGHGYVNGDWATYFTMTSGGNRGWIFKSFEYGNVASISAQGNAYFNGNITAASFTGAFTGNAATATTALNLATASGSAPSYSARAWVNFNGTGVVRINGAGNVTSITDNGTGDYTVNFLTAMPNANYATVFGVSDNLGGASLPKIVTNGNSTTAPATKTVSACRIGFGADVYDFSVVFFV